MTVGEFLTINNYRQFDHVLREVNQALNMDPALVFSQAAPGFLSKVTTNLGPWRGRDQMAFEFPSKNVDARAVGPEERARLGGYDKRQVVGLPGFEVAGFTHSVRPEDFLYGGMDASEASRRAARPRLSYNQLLAKKLLDTLTQGDFGGSVADDFAWSATNFNGETVTQQVLADTADQVPTVMANSTQTILWPKRDGSEFAAGHDHIDPNGGASWTLALARGDSELVLEHPGNDGVDAYVDVNNAVDIRAVLKSEYGAIAERLPVVHQSIQSRGGFCAAYPIVDNLEGVSYWYVPDMPADGALYVAANKKPWYTSIGQRGVDGRPVGTGAWSEQGNPETRGVTYGYRDYTALGLWDPIAAAYIVYVA